MTVVTKDKIKMGERTYPLTKRTGGLEDIDEKILVFPTNESWQEANVKIGDEVEQKQLLAKGVTRIYFQAKMSKSEATFTIRDEGAGFDTSIVPTAGDARLLERDGGQGLVLMTTFMSEVRFNDTGNEVTLVKHPRTVPE